jgi:acyl-CoA thioesterase
MSPPHPNDSPSASDSLNSAYASAPDQPATAAPLDRFPNATTTFPELMALAPLGTKETDLGAGPVTTSIFTSLTPAWASGGAWSAFGGHVYAQSFWAAAQTVGDGLVMTNTHGFFTLPGQTDRPFVYFVTPVAESRTISIRSVTVRQPKEASVRGDLEGFKVEDGRAELGGVCFHGVASFKIPAAAESRHQEVKDWVSEYQDALPLAAAARAAAASASPIDPSRLPTCPDVDTPWYAEVIKHYPEHRTFPGLDIRKADLSRRNAPAAPLAWRQLNYYRAVGSLPPHLPNLHCAAHLYASDRNSLFLISHAMGFGNKLAKIASLCHSVQFHTGSAGLLLDPEPRAPQQAVAITESGDAAAVHGNANLPDARGWFVQEAWSPRSGEQRGLHESKIWSPEGEHIATTFQDGLVKKAEGGRKRMFEEVIKRFDGDGKPAAKVEADEVIGRERERKFGRPVPKL